MKLITNQHPEMAMNARSAAEREFDITLIQNRFHDFLSRFEQ
jgi:hypothetical protein